MLFRSIGWTIGSFGLGQGFRLACSIALARLLSPEIIGLMTLINSIKTGVDLISDVGIAQSIVQNKEAEKPEFYDTAWTLKVIRGSTLFVVFLAASPFFAHLFDSQILLFILPVFAFTFIFDGVSSISPALMQKRMKIAELNIVGFVFEILPGTILVIFAFMYRSIWSFIFGLLLSTALKALITHFLLDDVRVRFRLSAFYAKEITRFGRWIFISSIVYFFATNLDRLYLGKIASFGMLGVYGIARSFSDLIVLLVSRICGYLVFPLIAAAAHQPRNALRGKIQSIRLHFILLTAFAIAVFAVSADLPIHLLYDNRYQAAAGMLPIMALGAWFSILCSINENIILGLAGTQYIAVGNVVRFIWFATGLPFGYGAYGFLGVVVVFACSDCFRYFALLIGQIRMDVSFLRDDMLATGLLATLFVTFAWMRWYWGFGLPFESLLNPLAFHP
jgi:O-antigen/teichoic acid export membrane protein